ncbi:MAG: type I restriction enzyme HsdR N-terminal domain-containing protein, partial [Candidatus Omnitrophota bacterium]
SDPAILIEAKPIKDDIGKKTTQIFNYMKNSKVTYGIVTNGRQLSLYSKFRVSKKCKKGRRLFDMMELKDFTNYADVLLFLSKDSVNSNRLDRLASEYNKKEYWDWKKEYKREYKDTAHDKLGLIYAKEKLIHLKDEE